MPSMSRELGCELIDSSHQIGIFIRLSQSQELLGNIRSSGRVANVFSLPSSNRTLQFKGSDARIIPFAPENLPVIEGHIADFLLEVLPLGMSEAVVRAILAYQPDDLVSVVYSPCAAFSQTPGPKAGTPLT